MIDYINELLNREEFFEKIYAKSNSNDSRNATQSAIINLDFYCEDVYKKSSDMILKDLKKDLDGTNNPGKVLRFLDKFNIWLREDHPQIVLTNKRNQARRPLEAKNPTSIKNYFSRVRKFMKLCYGIRITDDDVRDYITFPVSESDDEDAEPFESNELRNVIDHAKPKRKTMYMFMKDTGARLIETIRIKKKNIDFTHDPPIVTFPKGIVKGKTKTRINYLTKETAPRVSLLIKSMDDDDFIFRDNNQQTEHQARKNEQSAFRRLCDNLGYLERYEHNKRNKKNIHSIRAFCCTKYEEGTNSERLAHGYIGHKRYLEQYLRQSDEKKSQKFRQAESYLSLYDNMVIVQENKDEKMDAMEKQMELQGVMLREQQKFIEQWKKEKTPDIEN